MAIIVQTKPAFRAYVIESKTTCPLICYKV